jgi:NAD(P)-dependent dehydrogenase (short-subunit alcohol dehydrogenase family)
MEQKDKGVVMIFGASSGLGLAAAKHLKELGYKVVGTSRSAIAEGINFDLINCDVKDPDQINDCFKYVLKTYGEIQAVVNCAGVGLSGPTQRLTISQVRDCMDTNYMGAFIVLRAALENLRWKQKDLVPKIIQVSSVAGRVGIPFQAIYSASKFAVEGLFESTAAEIYDNSAHLVLVEPGDFATNFTANRIKAKERHFDNADLTLCYDMCQKAVGVMEESERKGQKPIVFAKLLKCILEDPQPNLRYVLARPLEKLAISLRWLPDSTYQSLVRGNYKIK